MNKYAFLRNNIVMLIDYLPTEEYSLHVPHWDSIIDVTNAPVEPKVGWLLEGNTLIPCSPELQQRDQQAFGSGLALDLVNKMGARNLLLASQGNLVNVAALLVSVGSVKLLVETGALKTARSYMQALAPSYVAYADIFTYGIDKITQFLQERGWD